MTLPSNEAALPAEMSERTPRGQARAVLAARFAGAGIDSADIDARLLVCAACGIDHVTLIRDPDMPLGLAADRLAALAARRFAREPVSRILGRREFWGLPFALSPDVLDPRPETEGLVGAILDAVGMRRGESLALLDLGVGSGAILGALLRELPAARGIGIDRSAEACHIAARNLAAIGAADRAAVVCGDWADPLHGRFDVIVSNPPYIARGELAGLDTEVRDHDPPAALDGGVDGFDAYRAIVPRLDGLLRPGGTAAFECGAGQGEAVAGLMRGAGMQAVSVYDDLAGRDRVVIGQRAAPL